MQTEQRWLNAIARSRMVAWRLPKITMAGRASPAVTGEVRFAPREWHTMYTLPQHRHPPQAPPSLRAMVRDLAHLGGV